MLLGVVVCNPMHSLMLVSVCLRLGNIVTDELMVQIMLPGDLLCKFMHERLEECLTTMKDLIKRDMERQPEKVNLQVRQNFKVVSNSHWHHGENTSHAAHNRKFVG